MLVVGLSDLGDGDAPRSPLQQPHSELPLEVADATAQLRGLQTQGAGGSAVAAVLHHLREQVHGVEVLHRGYSGAPIVL